MYQMMSGPHSRKKLGLTGVQIELGTLAAALGTEGGALGRAVSWVSVDGSPWMHSGFPLCRAGSCASRRPGQAKPRSLVFICSSQTHESLGARIGSSPFWCAENEHEEDREGKPSVVGTENTSLRKLPLKSYPHHRPRFARTSQAKGWSHQLQQLLSLAVRTFS